MHSTLRTKVSLWFVVVVLVVLLAGWLGYRRISENIRSLADLQMQQKLDHVMDVLEATNTTYMSLVRSSMRVLKFEAARLGPPSLRQASAPDGTPREELFFGEQSMSGSFDLVDRVKELMGGTATIFMKQGDTFLRITTNVPKAGGGRAIGTVLDPKGRAIAKIRKGEAFYGVVDILGKPYITGYEPIRDAAGQVIGVYYVGYALETLASVKQTIDQQHLLEHGFFALLDPADQVVVPGSESEFAAMARHLIDDPRSRTGSCSEKRSSRGTTK